MAYASKTFSTKLILILRVTVLRLLRMQPKNDTFIGIETHEGPQGPYSQTIDVILHTLVIRRTVNESQIFTSPVNITASRYLIKSKAVVKLRPILAAFNHISNAHEVGRAF